MTFYYDELIYAGVTGYSKDQFEYDFRLSVIACVFCPLIWKRMFRFGVRWRRMKIGIVVSC